MNKTVKDQNIIFEIKYSNNQNIKFKIAILNQSKGNECSKIKDFFAYFYNTNTNWYYAIYLK